MAPRLTRSEAEVEACFPVMRELRPTLTLDDFLQQVERQRQQGYQLAFIEADGEVVCVAGFRLLENFGWNRFLYVDDLVTKSECRSHGHGRALLEWLISYAREHECGEVHLDSGVQRFGAHRFYLTNSMDITCHHFAVRL